MSADSGASHTPQHALDTTAGGNAAGDTAASQPAEVTGVPADDAQALTAEIERTREELGQTVEALAAKVDVKSQARRKVAELRGRRDQVTAQAASQAATARGQVAAQAAAARDRAWQAAPPGVQRAAQQAAARVPDAARQRRVQGAAVAAVALLACWIIIRRRRQ